MENFSLPSCHQTREWQSQPRAVCVSGVQVPHQDFVPALSSVGVPVFKGLSSRAHLVKHFLVPRSIP